MIWSLDRPSNDMDSPMPCRKGTDERKALVSELEHVRSETVDVPLIIGGKEVRTEETFEIRSPHDRSLLLARASIAGPEEISMAVESSLSAKEEWAEMEWYHRASIFRKAADLLSCGQRFRNLAVIMENLSKNPYEADIDLAELVDFWRFNTYYMRFIYEQQPGDAPGEKNRMDWRPLEGFVLAIPPFNFYSISGNLATAPAMMGNVVIWKPSRSAILSSFEIMRLLVDSGLPPDVINFIPFNSRHSDMVLRHPELAAVHFTGSYATLTEIWRKVGEGISNYRNFPRIVGETGGKGFVFMHPSADLKNTAANIIRGAFSYQGQKCSAASRAYIPRSRWEEMRGILVSELSKMKVGAPDDMKSFMGALIDREAFERVLSYIEHAKGDPATYEMVYGGGSDARKGFFIDPTIVRSKDPKGKLMTEEIFGPVLTVYIYPDDDIEGALRTADRTSPYGLTGSIFAEDRRAIKEAERILRFSAGNFYINDKPTGAIVNRQPFGGARRSGTDDKAGSWLNLLRFTAPRTIKESTLRIDDWRYPFMR